MRDQALWYLENLDITGIFCPKKMSRVNSTHTLKKFKKGEYIYLPNEAADKIFFITEGRIKIGSYGNNGKEITKALLSKGEVFGELALVGEDKRRDYALAMDDATLCIVNNSEMRSLMREHNGLELFMMKIFSSRILAMEQRLESLVFKDSRSRIIEFLLEINRKRGQRVGYEYVVRKFITHQEIANLTATSRQTVTTVLNELRSRNLLTFNRRRLLIRDLDKLRAEVEN
jgi:CRP/FNR family cyclic AMP-dependent transcriptional regulator